MTDQIEDMPENSPGTVSAQNDVRAVSGRLESMYHLLVAAHDLCAQQIADNGSEAVTTFVLLRDLFRSMARDAEHCSEVLENKPGSLGYFEGHFGRI